MKKKICIILVSIIMLMFVGTNSFAAGPMAGTDSLDSAARGIYSGSTHPRLSQPLGIVLGVIQAIGYAVGITVLTFIGIKYVLSTPEGKADLKKQLVPYLIGAILLLSGTTLVLIIGNVAKDAL